jgi:formylglycine-generating enzyme required for sulfatase activity
MLDQAQDLASDNGDVWLVDRTTIAKAEAFQIDALAEELELLQKLATKTKGSVTSRDLAEAALQLADLLVAADRFDDAKRAFDLALSASRKAQDTAFNKYVTDRNKQFTTAKTAFDPVAKAAVTLQSDPNNAEANLVVGRNRCFDHYDWSGGLPHLAKGSDATLADLASRSLKTPFDSESTAKMADAWWDAAEANSSQRNEWILGARFFYRLALPGQASADDKKRIEERLSEIARLRGAETSQLPSTIDLAIAPGEVMRFRLVPAGDFEMGSSAAKSKAVTPHSVKITKPFYISTTEVTQAQFELVMARKPSDVGSQYPYFGEETKVAWADADTFCKKLNALSAFGAYQSRLPTEAEWEYAARAGSTANYSFGDDPQLLPQFAIFGRQEPEPVGTLRPNGVGLFDVQGNVSEWCSDWESTTFYASSPPEDPTGPATGKERAYRGGQFNSTAEQCQIWQRQPGAGSKPSVGIRVVLGL